MTNIFSFLENPKLLTCPYSYPRNWFTVAMCFFVLFIVAQKNIFLGWESRHFWSRHSFSIFFLQRHVWEWWLWFSEDLKIKEDLIKSFVVSPINPISLGANRDKFFYIAQMESKRFSSKYQSIYFLSLIIFFLKSFKLNKWHKKNKFPWCNGTPVFFANMFELCHVAWRSVFFKSCHRFPVGLRCGLSLGHSRTSTLLSLNHFCVALAWCFRSLCCWKINVLWSHRSLVDGN